MSKELLVCDKYGANCVTGAGYGDAFSIPSYNIPMSSTPNIPTTYMPSPAETGFSLHTIGTFLGTNINWLLLILTATGCFQLWKNYKNKENKIGTLFSLGLLSISVWGVFCYNMWFGLAFIAISVGFIAQSENYKFGPEEYVEEDVQRAPSQIPQRIPQRAPPASMYDDGMSMNGNIGTGLNLRLF